MNKRIFISYSWNSNSKREIVYNLSRSLQTHGYGVVIDQRDINIGNNIKEYFDELIRSVDVIIILIDKNYLLGKYTKYEIERLMFDPYYLNQVKTIPVITDEISLKSIPWNTNIIDATRINSTNLLTQAIIEEIEYKEFYRSQLKNSLHKNLQEIYDSNISKKEDESQKQNIDVRNRLLEFIKQYRFIYSRWIKPSISYSNEFLLEKGIGKLVERSNINDMDIKIRDIPYRSDYALPNVRLYTFIQFLRDDIKYSNSIQPDSLLVESRSNIGKIRFVRDRSSEDSRIYDMVNFDPEIISKELTGFINSNLKDGGK